MALYLCTLQESNGTNLLDYIKDIGPIIVGILALFFAYLQNNKTLAAAAAQNTRTLNAKALEEKRNEIYKKLNEFYGPIIQLRKKSHLLYLKFSERLIKQDSNFATLPYLLNRGELLPNEDILLKEIIEIGTQIETLIHLKAGLIDVPELRLNLIPRASTHFLIMKLAYSRVLSGDANRYMDLTFPRDLDDLLEARKLDLENELKILNTIA